MNWFSFKWEKAHYAILFLFIIPMTLDFWSTFRSGEFVEHLEGNPLFKYIGLWGIILFNFVILYFLLRQYGKEKTSGRFAVISVVVWLSAIRLYVVKQNLEIVESIESGALTIAEAATVTEETKQAYFLLISLAILLPMLITNLCFWLFRLDHIVVKKED